MDEALSASEVDGLMQACAFPPSDKRLALAVSGGPDSMAMSLAVQRWTQRHHLPPPLAFIVDHGLRVESAAEAGAVKARLGLLGVHAEILRWEHAPVAARLHSEARRARYRLLLEACRRHGLSALLFAHQRDDQAETILMRFAKGTGIDGLAGIPAYRVMQGVHIFRPFLTVPKQKLIATCVAENIAFVCDPSNGLQKFARGRMRRALPLLAEDGLTVERLIDFGRRAAEARDALDHYTGQFLSAASRQNEFGVLVFDKTALLAVPRAIALRSLALALQAVHTEDYAPNHAALSLLFDALREETAMPARTLNGCLIRQSGGRVIIGREYAGITEQLPLQPGEDIVWDGRWRVRLDRPPASQSYTVRALGNPAHDLLDRLAPGLRRRLPQGRVRAALPALWSGNDLAMIPFQDQNDTASAQLLGAWPPPKRN